MEKILMIDDDIKLTELVDEFLSSNNDIECNNEADIEILECTASLAGISTITVIAKNEAGIIQDQFNIEIEA